MRQRSVLRFRVLSLATAFGLAIASPGVAHAVPVLAPRDAVRVTQAEVTASNAKVRMAYDDLARMWSDDFAQIGERFAVPALVRFRGAVRTGCGVLGPDNAAYCPTDNRIYFDELFVAAQAKLAARQVGTDGDMAAVGVIAHEMGHAVALQLGHSSPYTYQNEAVADCLAGAFAHRADANGSLEKGDVDEAFYAMFTAGDPDPELTGDRRTDRRILVHAALMGHGTYEQRMRNFKEGLDGGAPACLIEFRGIDE